MEGEISYEQYLESVECTSQEEGERGAAYGRESARNKTFEKAQKLLDEAKKRDDELKLTKEKKEYEAKRIEMVERLREAEKTSLAAIEGAKNEAGEQVVALVAQRKDVLLADHEAIEQRTEQKVEALLTAKIAQAQEQAIQEVREQELLKPGRDAVQAARQRAGNFEQRVQRGEVEIRASCSYWSAFGWHHPGGSVLFLAGLVHLVRVGWWHSLLLYLRPRGYEEVG